MVPLLSHSAAPDPEPVRESRDGESRVVPARGGDPAEAGAVKKSVNSMICCRGPVPAAARSLHLFPA